MEHDEPESPRAGPEGARRSGLYARWLEKPELSEADLEKRRVASCLRRLVDRMLSTAVPARTLSQVADMVEQAEALLSPSADSPDYSGYGETSLWGGDPHAQFENSPLIGRANPLAPPLDLWEEDGVVKGRVVFSAAYEGPPGHVHGGYVAAVFDELLGAAQSLSESPGMTGTLAIRYESPTPLGVELSLEGRITRVAGRKIFTEGSLRAGDVLCARADAIFVSIPLERFVEMKLRRDRESRPRR